MKHLSALVLGAVMSVPVVAQETTNLSTIDEPSFFVNDAYEQTPYSLKTSSAQERTFPFNRCFAEQRHCSSLGAKGVVAGLNLSFAPNNSFLGFFDASYDPDSYSWKVRGRRCFSERSCLGLEKQSFSSNPSRNKSVAPLEQELYKSSWTLSWSYRF